MTRDLFWGGTQRNMPKGYTSDTCRRSQSASDSGRMRIMKIRSRTFVSLDGYVTTPDGWPVQMALGTFSPHESHGYGEFTAASGAAVMGRTTFLPALGAPSWPWPTLQVFVLTSQPLPPETPADVVVSQGGPAGLLEQMRAANFDGDVHLVGGPQTIKAFADIGALDRMEILVAPIMTGQGLPLSVAGTDVSRLQLLEVGETYPDGTIELIYAPPPPSIAL